MSSSHEPPSSSAEDSLPSAPDDVSAASSSPSTSVRERWRSRVGWTGAALLGCALLGVWIWPGQSGEQSAEAPAWKRWVVGLVHRIEQHPRFAHAVHAPKLNAVVFANTRGWIVGDNGLVLWTEDNGERWKRLEQAVQVPLVEEEFVDVRRLAGPDGESHWYLLARNGVLLRYAENGATWQRWKLETATRLPFAPTRLLGWSGADLILASSNGLYRAEIAGSEPSIQLVWAATIESGGIEVAGVQGEHYFVVTADDQWIQLSPESAAKSLPQQQRQQQQQQQQAVAFSKNQQALTAEPLPYLVPVARQSLSSFGTTRWTNGYFVSDETGWLIGERGAVALTLDGGESWEPVNLNTAQALVGMAFSAQDQASTRSLRGWMVGLAGKVFSTADGGETWAAAETGVETGLNALGLDALGRIWAVGKHGVIVRSDDQGQTWTRVELYRYLPAPLHWILGLAGLAALVTSAVWPMRPPPVVRSILNAFVADLPLTERAQAPAWMQKLVSGLANYIGNPATAAPITLAITGAWGRGKSSVMNLLRRELEEREHRPVWFNAWHHQDADNVLAALLATIREQAIPPLVTFPKRPPFLAFPGVIYYLRLLWQRAQRRWMFVIALHAVLLVVVAWVVKNAPAMSQIRWTELSDVLDKEGLPGLLGALAIGAVPVAKLLGLLKTFGIDPAKLVAVEGGTRATRDVEAANVFRTRFAVEFAEVTAALGKRHRMVIFIDDLDRCSPEHLLKVLEATNLLNSSGQCFIVLGMQRETVLGALARALDQSLTTEFASPERWLEKLVQIEIPVPRDDKMLDSVTQRKAPDRDRNDVTRRWQRLAVLSSLGTLTAFTLVAACLTLAEKLSIVPRESQGVVRTAPINATPAETGAVAPGETGPAAGGYATPGTANADPQAVRTVTVVERPIPRDLTPEEEAETRGGPVSAVPFAVGVLALGGGALLLVTLQRRFRTEVQDSPAFMAALKDWEPVLIERCSTPRELKLLLNRMRFDAMLVREFAPSTEGIGATIPESEARNDQVSGFEADIVGLVLIERFDPDALDHGQPVVLQSPPGAWTTRVDQAISTYRSRAFAAFRHFKEGFRVGG